MAGKRSSIAAAVTRVITMAWVQSLALDLPHAVREVKKKNKDKNKIPSKTKQVIEALS